MKAALRTLFATASAAGLIFASNAIGQPAATAPAAKPAPPSAAVLARGKEIWDGRCIDCHDPPVEDAPAKEDIAAYKPDFIIGVLTSGSMEAKATGLTQDDLKALATYLTTPQ